MVVVPLAATEIRPAPASQPDLDARYWLRVAAAGTLAASGALLMAGKRRAGLIAAATGAALAVIDQQETVRIWWDRLPAFLEDVQSVLARVQKAVDQVSAQGERLRSVLKPEAKSAPTEINNPGKPAAV